MHPLHVALLVYLLGGIGYAFSCRGILLRQVHEQYEIRPEFLPAYSVAVSMIAMGFGWPVTLPYATFCGLRGWVRLLYARRQLRRTLRASLKPFDLVLSLRPDRSRFVDLLEVRSVQRDQLEGRLVATTLRPVEDLQTVLQMNTGDLAWLPVDQIPTEQRELTTIVGVMSVPAICSCCTPEE